MSLKRQQNQSNQDNAPPSKKQKLNTPSDSNEDIMANLDLDLNIVAGSQKTPINVNFYSQKMKEIQIDAHIYFQYNPKNYAHNILWKNKVLLPKSLYAKYQKLITKRNPKFCHFHQPSPKQILEMYKMAPLSLQHSRQCSTILYSLHKAIMSNISDNAYKQRNRRELQKELANLEITNIQNYKFLNSLTSKDSKNKNNAKIAEFLEIKSESDESSNHQKTLELSDIIDDYGFKDNIFHKLSKQYRIAPVVLLRDYLKLNFGLTGNNAKSTLVLLSRKTSQSNMSDCKDMIYKLYNVSIDIAILNAIFIALMTDCIRGYNQKIAWLGWNEKVMQSKNETLVKIFSKCQGKGAHFLEHTLIGKFRGMIAKINERIFDERDKIKILNESEQKMKIRQLKREKVSLWKQMHSNASDMSENEILKKIGWFEPPTPDLLFSRPVMVNGSFVYWMDSKNFLFTSQDKVKYRKISQQIGKYNKAFGNGAIVCLGFEPQKNRFLQQVMLLDASYWVLSL